jgi:GTP-dependent phosphoenolpyruvate carboxykinase
MKLYESPCINKINQKFIHVVTLGCFVGSINGITLIVIYTISGIKAILQDSSVKIADDEGVSPSSSVITRVSCNML